MMSNNNQYTDYVIHLIFNIGNNKKRRKDDEDQVVQRSVF